MFLLIHSVFYHLLYNNLCCLNLSFKTNFFYQRFTINFMLLFIYSQCVICLIIFEFFLVSIKIIKLEFFSKFFFPTHSVRFKTSTKRFIKKVFKKKKIISLRIHYTSLFRPLILFTFRYLYSSDNEI